jgi:hypothetical protein
LILTGDISFDTGSGDGDTGSGDGDTGSGDGDTGSDDGSDDGDNACSACVDFYPYLEDYYPDFDLEDYYPGLDPEDVPFYKLSFFESCAATEVLSTVYTRTTKVGVLYTPDEDVTVVDLRGKYKSYGYLTNLHRAIYNYDEATNSIGTLIVSAAGLFKTFLPDPPTLIAGNTYAIVFFSETVSTPEENTDWQAYGYASSTNDGICENIQQRVVDENGEFKLTGYIMDSTLLVLDPSFELPDTYREQVDG